MNQTFIFHDVLQEYNLNKIQRNELKKSSYFDLFKTTMESFEKAENISVILLILAEGIDSHPDVVAYIKSHPEWIIALHGLHHERMIGKTKERQFLELSCAKQKLEETFGQNVNIFIPPWLKATKATINVCKELGLEIPSRKEFFAIKYMDLNKINDIPRFDVHHWVPQDREKVKLFFGHKQVDGV